MTIPPPLLRSLAHKSHLTLHADCFEIASKAWSTEGGIRCPAIVRHPSIPDEKRGGVEHAFTTVMDILPTVVSPDLQDRPPDKIR
jgi:arylsulfatase A-like enzyme